MPVSLQAVYEKGMLRPLQPLPFKENQQLTLLVQSTSDVDEDLHDEAFQSYCESQADESVTLEAVRKALSTIPGSMTADFVAERDER